MAPFLTGVVSAVWAGTGGPAAGATLRVPSDYSTILAAVDAAAEGDTVEVGPGTWTDRESRVVYSQGQGFLTSAHAFPRHGMVIRGQGVGVTILDASLGGAGSQQNIIPFVEPVGTTPLIVEGMTLRELHGDEGVVGIVSLENGGLQVRACRFENISSGSFGPVAARGCSVVMEDCEVVGCTAPSATVWLVRGVLEGDALEVRRCRFLSNVGRCIQADFDGELNPGPVRIEDCEFTGNRGPGYGVCLDVYYNDDVYIARNVFLRNVAELYPAAAIRDVVCTVTAEFNVFAYDSVLASNGRGGAVWSDQSRATFKQNTFVGCHSSHGGAALDAVFGGTIRFDGNVVCHTTGAQALNAFIATVLSSECNVFWDNPFGDTENWIPTTAFHIDPLFCNHLGGDWTVQSNSFCVHASCGPIGALGVGCDDIAIEPTTWGKLKAAYRLPR